MKNTTILNVLIAGGSGASGIAAARALRQSACRVFTVGSDKDRIKAAAIQAGEGVIPLVCDLASLPDVRALHSDVTSVHGPIDGVIHLVGGWRGAKGITGQTDEDWDFLERSAITTVRNVSRVFYDDLAASETGRFAMVSSTAVNSPTAGTASYVAAKAAAEAWTMAVAEGFAAEQTAPHGDQHSVTGLRSVTDQHSVTGLHSAAVVFVVKALLDDAMRKRSPERSFPGYTDVEELAAAIVKLFRTPASELNGRRLLLAPSAPGLGHP